MAMRLGKKILMACLLAAAAVCGAIAFYNWRIPEVRVVAVHTGSIRVTVEETGHVQTGESYDIQAPSAGRIIRIAATHGQTVRVGQTILVLQNLATETQLSETGENIRAALADRDHASAILNSAKSDLENIRKEMERDNRLYKAGAISRVELETVENNLRKSADAITSLEANQAAAEHRLAALQSQQKGIAAQLDQMMITSPINAKVLSLPVKTGQVVPSGALLATVGSQGASEVYAEILSDEIVRLHPGQPASVSLGTDADQPLTGHIKEIYPQAVEKLSPLGVLQRRVPILVALDANGPLKPGYEVNLSICTASRENVLIAPRESISVDKNGLETVKVVRDGRVAVQKIVTGLKNQYYAEILQGLREGTPLIGDGSLPYENGARVKAVTD